MNGKVERFDVAVKQIHCVDENLINEFRIEASLLHSLSHPNIVRMIGMFILSIIAHC